MIIQKGLEEIKMKTRVNDELSLGGYHNVTSMKKISLQINLSSLKARKGGLRLRRDGEEREGR